MKTILASSLALALLTGAALAQAVTPAPAGIAPAAAPAAGTVAPPAPPPPPAVGDSAGAGPMPPPPPGGPRGARLQPGGPGAMDDGGPEGPRGHRPPPPPPRGAHIHLQRGDLMLDVKCAEDEPMKSCADTALQMLDHLQAAPKAQ